MLVLSFFSWWYSQGWKQVATSLSARLSGVAEAFSVSQLLRTLFAPWRRIITPPGAGLSAKLHAMLDNVISRAIGFVVRLLVLLAAVLIAFAILAVTIAEVIVWPVLPLAVPVLIVKGLI